MQSAPGTKHLSSQLGAISGWPGARGIEWSGLSPLQPPWGLEHGVLSDELKGRNEKGLRPQAWH